MSTANPYVPPVRVSPPPPPPPAPPGSSIDFGRAFSFFFQDPKWVEKLLVGSLFTILSMFVVGSVFIAGYAARLVRRTARGEPHPLPEWEDLGGMFVEGLYVVGAYLAHILPVVAAIVVMVLPVAILSEGDGEPSPAALFALLPLIFAFMVLLVALLFYFSSAFIRLAAGNRFGAAFEFPQNLAFLKRNLVNLLLAVLAFIAASFLAQFGILLFCIGILPATFWSQCVGAYALGEVALRDPDSKSTKG